MMMMGMGMGVGNNHQVTPQNEAGGSNNNNNGGGGEGGIVLKKGPWTAAEDAVLADYVRTHGEGNWNAVQKNTGLARCGKSCRLRWANHLRPNLKKGAFSPEEERIICEMHAKMGNKWARMATQLPGRTDNEIKNYWNTRVKRRQRQGLPLYPPEIQPIYNQNQQNHQHHHRSLPKTPLMSPRNASTSSFSFQTPTTLSSPTAHHSSMLAHPHPLHMQRSSSSHILYNHHSTQPPLHSPGGAVSAPISPLPSPSQHHHVSPLQSPHNHRPQFSTLPLFDNSNHSNINFNNANSHNNIPSDFFFPRATPPLQTPTRYKRFKHDTSHESNIERHNNNIGFIGSNDNGTSSSFMLQYPPLQKTSFFNAHAAATIAANSSLASPHHYSPSFSYDPVTLDLSSASRMLNDHHQFDTGHYISNPGFSFQLKTNDELPLNQFLFLDGNSDVTFDTKGNDSYISNDHSNNRQNLSMSFSGGGLLDDMLEEPQMLANNDEFMRRQKCMAGFNGSSGDLASGQSVNNVGFEGKEETVTDQEINATQEDYSRLLDSIPSSMPMTDWYNNCGKSPTGGL